MREWTDSTVQSSNDKESHVVRGGPGTARRCAARSRATGKGMPARMAFRCCHGDRNDVAVAPIESRSAFRKTDLDAAALEKIFAGVPELARIGEGVRLYGEADVKTILARSAPRARADGTTASVAEGISFATSPILWSPEPGVELLVATGRAKKTGFVRRALDIAGRQVSLRVVVPPPRLHGPRGARLRAVAPQGAPVDDVLELRRRARRSEPARRRPRRDRPVLTDPRSERRRRDRQRK